jgi:monoamine oxidase
MSARLLEHKLGSQCRVTLFEASKRLGGKIQTRSFDSAPATYEAGVAECYDFEAFGHDPLKALVRQLGLRPLPTQSNAMAIDGVILADDREVGVRYGARTRAAIHRFRREAAAMLPLANWYRGFTPADNSHPWANCSGEDLLAAVDDPIAERYLRTLIHSDLATEPHLVNGLIGLRNVLKNVPGFGAQYTIEGGMEMLPRQLAAGLARTEVQLEAPVSCVSRTRDGSYALDVHQDGQRMRQIFDAVVVALPYYELRHVEWTGRRLQRALTRHIAHYDHPGHYLRISILFDQPFWREAFSGSWLMLDAFGGCCLYDERGVDTAPGYGVLGWLLAGADALAQSSEDDHTLIARALDSLPASLRREARLRAVEAKVHRWAGAVSSTPGGFPLRDPRAAHRPEPLEHERLVVVGDYLFDSTLNGVLRSAEIATDLVAARLPARNSPLTATLFTRAESPAAAP